MNQDQENIGTNMSGNTPFADILAVSLKRRSVLRGGALGAAAFFAGGVAFSKTALADGHGLMGSWTAIPTSGEDTVSVPDGYTAQPFIPWGTPIVPSGPAFKQDASNSAAEQEVQLGMGHDGIRYFPLSKRTRGGSVSGLLALNHEYTVDKQLFTDGTANWTAEKTRKSQAAHGVSIVEVHKAVDGVWHTAESSRARRIHGNTPTQMSGPAAGHRLLL